MQGGSPQLSPSPSSLPPSLCCVCVCLSVCLSVCGVVSQHRIRISGVAGALGSRVNGLYARVYENGEAPWEHQDKAHEVNDREVFQKLKDGTLFTAADPEVWLFRASSPQATGEGVLDGPIQERWRIGDRLAKETCGAEGSIYVTAETQLARRRDHGPHMEEDAGGNPNKRNAEPAELPACEQPETWTCVIEWGCVGNAEANKQEVALVWEGTFPPRLRSLPSKWSWRRGLASLEGLLRGGDQGTEDQELTRERASFFEEYLLELAERPLPLKSLAAFAQFLGLHNPHAPLLVENPRDDTDVSTDVSLVATRGALSGVQPEPHASIKRKSVLRGPLGSLAIKASSVPVNQPVLLDAGHLLPEKLRAYFEHLGHLDLSASGNGESDEDKSLRSVRSQELEVQNSMLKTEVADLKAQIARLEAQIARLRSLEQAQHSSQSHTVESTVAPASPPTSPSKVVPTGARAPTAKRPSAAEVQLFHIKQQTGSMANGTNGKDHSSFSDEDHTESELEEEEEEEEKEEVVPLSPEFDDAAAKIRDQREAECLQGIKCFIRLTQDFQEGDARALQLRPSLFTDCFRAMDRFSFNTTIQEKALKLTVNLAFVSGKPQHSSTAPPPPPTAPTPLLAWPWSCCLTHSHACTDDLQCLVPSNYSLYDDQRKSSSESWMQTPFTSSCIP